MPNVYFISGLGAKCAIFDRIILPKNHTKIYLEWNVPKKNETIESYAKRMAELIDTTIEFTLIGLSFGGIMIQEIAKFTNPTRLILISSIKSETEIKGILKIIQKSKIYNCLPSFVFNAKGVFIFLFFRKIYSKKLPNIGNYLLNIESYYYTWSIKQIMNWSNKTDTQKIPIYRIHGTKDPVFPLKKENTMEYFIENGNHVLVLQKSHQINTYLELIFK